MKLLLTALFAGALLTVLTGCNTIEGAGKDVKATGAAVERAPTTPSRSNAKYRATQKDSGPRARCPYFFVK